MTLSDQNVLRVEGLSISVSGTPLVSDVSFGLKAGKTLALVGESGSGKSLTALSLLKLLPSSMQMQGQVWLGEEDIAALPLEDLRSIRGKRVGMIFQEPLTALNPLHTIGAQIAEAITLHQLLLKKSEVRARVENLLHEVGLEAMCKRLDAYPHELSGGQRQRVMIAMAIANDPEVLIADEPTTALDVTVQEQILALLQRLQRERQMAVLLITHDLTLVQRYATDVAVMQQGRIVETAPTSELFANPRHEYTRFLLGAAPKGEAVALAKDAAELLQAENITVRFASRTSFWGKAKDFHTAVQAISLDVRAGETVGIVGESGSGKSTLALALLRLVKAEGRVVFDGISLESLTPKALRQLRQRMQLVFQDPFSSLNPRMNIGDCIAEGLCVHQPSLSEAERQRQVEDILSEVGLPRDILQRYPHEFSGGQRQRIALARALILKPSLLVLDEPTSALDLASQSHIIDLLKKLQEQRGLSYLFISHDLRVIRAIAHRVMVLKEGKVVEQGAMADIFTAPQQPYTQALLRAAFPEKEKLDAN